MTKSETWSEIKKRDPEGLAKFLTDLHKRFGKPERVENVKFKEVKNGI